MRFINRSAALLLLAYLLASRASFAAEYQLHTLTDQLHHPWSLAQLPGGDLLVTERRGRLLRVPAAGGATQEIAGVPATLTGGQGGFFDIALHPDFENSHWVYLAYARGSKGANATAVFRARLSGNTLTDGEDILVVQPDKPTRQHYGGRLLFLQDGTLLLSTGDAFDLRDHAQSLQSELGKVLRLRDDGTAVHDNPFPEPGAERIWTLGHRNPQGLAQDSVSGAIYLHEHGPRGGDELNRLVAGSNYGWPVATRGLDYSGAYVSPFSSLPGMAEALHTWTPSIGPSGLTVYQGDAFPQWRGRVFAGALVNREVRMLSVSGDEVRDEQAIFSEVGERIRDVRTGRDGLLYLLTDSENGRLIQVRPAPASAGAGGGEE